MDYVTLILTSGGVSAVVAALAKLISDTDQSRRNFLSGVLTEAYKREAEVYKILWGEMYAVQEAGSDFLRLYSMKHGPGGGFDVEKDTIEEAGMKLLKAGLSLVRVMDQNRPFFHPDVYLAVAAFTKFAKNDQWLRLMYPALHDMKGTLAGKLPPEFDYEGSIGELNERIGEVSKQIRARMTRPEEALMQSWSIFEAWKPKRPVSETSAGK